MSTEIRFNAAQEAAAPERMAAGSERQKRRTWNVNSRANISFRPCCEMFVCVL
jgi:hypothetical protein